jgi:uncharacterized RDD family membrane protein YckC
MRGKIACSVHANREASTACGACGIRLCDACAVSANGVDFCENCAPESAIRHEFDEDYERIPVIDPQRVAYPGLWRRVVGLVADLGIAAVIATILGIVVFAWTARMPKFFSPQGGVGFYLFWSAVIVLSVCYSAVLTSMTGQTLGKQWAGVIILQPDGHILNLQQSTIRSLMAVVSAGFFGLGYLWAIWDPSHETWHDKVAGTRAFLWEEMS